MKTRSRHATPIDASEPARSAAQPLKSTFRRARPHFMAITSIPPRVRVAPFAALESRVQLPMSIQARHSPCATLSARSESAPSAVHPAAANAHKRICSRVESVRSVLVAGAQKALTPPSVSRGQRETVRAVRWMRPASEVSDRSVTFAQSATSSCSRFAHAEAIAATATSPMLHRASYEIEQRKKRTQVSIIA